MIMRAKPIEFTEEQKRAKLAEWMELRLTMGATEAMRAVGVPEERMRKWARKFSVVVPPVDRSLSISVQLGMAPPVARTDAEWRTVIGEWIAARLHGVASVPAAKGLGMLVSTLEHHAKRLGVVIPAEVKRMKGPNPWEEAREKERERTFKKFMGLIGTWGVSKAAASVGRSVAWAREQARKRGVDLTEARRAGRVGVSDFSTNGLHERPGANT